MLIIFLTCFVVYANFPTSYTPIITYEIIPTTNYLMCTSYNESWRHHCCSVNIIENNLEYYYQGSAAS